jgi:hypothetical protein
MKKIQRPEVNHKGHNALQRTRRGENTKFFLEKRRRKREEVSHKIDMNSTRHRYLFLDQFIKNTKTFNRIPPEAGRYYREFLLLAFLHFLSGGLISIFLSFLTKDFVFFVFFVVKSS